MHVFPQSSLYESGPSLRSGLFNFPCPEHTPDNFQHPWRVNQMKHVFRVQTDHIPGIECPACTSIQGFSSILQGI